MSDAQQMDIDATAEVVQDEPLAPAPDRAAAPVAAVTATATTDVALRAPGHEPLMPINTADVVAGMHAYQQLLPQLLTASDFESAGDKRFVTRSGWRKIARAFNLTVVLVERTVERDDTGSPVRAEAVARAIAPNGKSEDGDGYCSVDEERFRSPKSRAKLEHDLRSTATTRAKSRAIADLIGMGDTGDPDVAAVATPELTDAAMSALASILHGDAAQLEHASKRLNDQFGGRVLTPVAQALVIVGQSVARLREAGQR